MVTGSGCPKGALHALCMATGNSRRELQYRMAFADKFPTEADMCNVLHISWHEIIGKHLTSTTERQRQQATTDQAKPGKAVDGFTVMRDTDVITMLKAWKRNVFRVESIATYPEDSRRDMILCLKRIADRLLP